MTKMMTAPKMKQPVVDNHAFPSHDSSQLMQEYFPVVSLKLSNSYPSWPQLLSWFSTNVENPLEKFSTLSVNISTSDMKIITPADKLKAIARLLGLAKLTSLLKKDFVKMRSSILSRMLILAADDKQDPDIRNVFLFA